MVYVTVTNKAHKCAKEQNIQGEETGEVDGYSLSINPIVGEILLKRPKYYCEVCGVQFCGLQVHIT